MGWPSQFESTQERRKQWLNEGEPSVARFVGQIGVLGWIIVAPTLIGLFIGRWLDHKLGTGIFWSAPLLLLRRSDRILVCLAMDAQAMTKFYSYWTRFDSMRDQRRRMARSWCTHWRVALSDAAMERSHVGNWPITPAGIGDPTRSLCAHCRRACHYRQSFRCVPIARRRRRHPGGADDGPPVRTTTMIARLSLSRRCLRLDRFRSPNPSW